MVRAVAGWVSDVQLDFAYSCNEENKSFGVIPDLQLFTDTQVLIYLNASVYDRKCTELMTVTLTVKQGENAFHKTMHCVHSQY